VLFPVAVLLGGGDTFFLLPVAFVVWILAAQATAAPAATRAGTKVVNDARTVAHGYGAGGVPGQRVVAVALFGPVALWRSDPALARSLGFVRPGGGRAGSGSPCRPPDPHPPPAP
jgi:hypothetical protein